MRSCEGNILKCLHHFYSPGTIGNHRQPSIIYNSKISELRVPSRLCGLDAKYYMNSVVSVLLFPVVARNGHSANLSMCLCVYVVQAYDYSHETPARSPIPNNKSHTEPPNKNTCQHYSRVHLRSPENSPIEKA